MTKFLNVVKDLPIRFRRNTHILSLFHSILFIPTTPLYLKERFEFISCSHNLHPSSQRRLITSIHNTTHSAPSITTVKFWAAEFKRKSLADDESSGRPETATIDENIAKVHQMVLDDRRIKVREIAEVRNISKERVCHILNQHLDMRKLSARWMPRFLTLDQKLVQRNIKQTSKAQ
ncbi:hypothetical protein K1T71_008029 [Dendrolimus kikuchii]|uniref:Uncharacterized protein n=1 Tax=Dendrolimus kikuchii TaxID=765133 RepID=A0ACC1CYY6_9NEOP|nr:hypothetical protein K1T71_008029 [Dendrolimus kikuchii]